MTARAEVLGEAHAFPPLREIGLWAGAALFVVLTHVAIAYAIQALRPLDPPVEATEPALMIDLAPLAFSTPETVEAESVTEEIPQETVEPVDDVQEVVEEQVEPAETAELDEPVEPETTQPLQAEPETAEVEPAEPEVVEPELIEPEVAEVTPEVAIPLPEPRPVVKEPEKKQPIQKAEPRKKEPRKTVEKPAPKKEVAKAEPKAKPAARASAASRTAKAPTVSPARWQARVLARIKRFQRYPRGAKSRGEEGVVGVNFVIDSSGAVISTRLSRSSGSSELDRAALDSLRRASPMPAPPPGIRSLSVPVQFNLR